MRAWLATATAGQKGQTRGPASEVGAHRRQGDQDKILEEDDGSGQDEEEEEDQQDPFQEDHVDVTNLLHLLNRSVTPPLSPHF